MNLPIDADRSASTASSTLLERVRASDARAWQRFAALYAPWVYRLARRAGLNENDAADVGQEVFMTAALRIDSFRREEPGQSMRRWLAQITRNKIGDWMRVHNRTPTAIGGRNRQVSEVADTNGFSNEEFVADAEDEGPLIRRAVELIRTDFQERTWLAFRRTVLESGSTTEVAAELGMTSKAVRQARYRVLRRLREEFDGLIDVRDLE